MKIFIRLAVFTLFTISASVSSLNAEVNPKNETTEIINKGDHTTTVVIYKNGKRVGKGYRVSLEFEGLLGGFTKDFYTDSDGVAYVEHASEGSVKVYVDGNWSNHKTKGRAPGKIIVYL